MTAGSSLDWPSTAMALGSSVLFTAVLVVVIWQAAASWRARAALAREAEYRKLADRATAAQEQTVAELTQLRIRLDQVEEVLRQVE
jgi:predicted nucleic acid-binding Zn ribbon protein